jgi:thiol-disulfide isomerase/thioredoxin
MKFYTLIVLFFSLNNNISAQDTIQPPYKKFPSYPPVKLLNADSTSFYTKDDLPKKKKVMLVLFNPQCEHCQHEAETLTNNLDKFKKIHIVMTTTAPIYEMLNFANKYKLAEKSNIVFAQDTNYFLLSFYNLRNLPFHAFYGKNKELISVAEGSMTLEKIMTELSK